MRPRQPDFKEGLNTDYWGFVNGIHHTCPEDGTYAKVYRKGEDSFGVSKVECKKGDRLEGYLVAGPLAPEEIAWFGTTANLMFVEDLRIFASLMV